MLRSVVGYERARETALSSDTCAKYSYAIIRDVDGICLLQGNLGKVCDSHFCQQNRNCTHERRASLYAVDSIKWYLPERENRKLLLV